MDFDQKLRKLLQVAPAHIAAQCLSPLKKKPRPKTYAYLIIKNYPIDEVIRILRKNVLNKPKINRYNRVESDLSFR
jgi:hypothetical protein